MSRLVHSRLMKALLVVALLCASQVAHAQLQGLLILQMKGYITLTSDYIASHYGTAVTYASTATFCFNSGGVPASDPTASSRTVLANWARSAGAARSSTFFTGGSGAATAANPNKCFRNVPDTTPATNSGNCAYRYRYGFYDMYTYRDEPGTAFWQGLYYTTGASQVLNQYEQYLWNTSGPTTFPHGSYNTVNGYAANAVSRMDVPDVPVNNDPNPLALYMAICEVQLYPILPLTTTRMPQPDFVNGFKTLTWPQEHWWVIFLIVAIILLVILIAIVIYCCISSVKPKEEPPLFAMVIRERVGKAYIVTDDVQQAADETKANNALMMRHQQQSQPMQQQQQQQPVQQQEEPQSANAQRRLGRGFTPQEQRQDPEDPAMGAAGIFGRGGNNQYGDGNAYNGSHEKGDNYYANASGTGLREEELASMGGDAASGAASGTVSRKRSSRRSRGGRTISQTVDDVELPQGGEIDEANYQL